MYFPILNTMSRYQVDDYLAKKLDVWLGTRRSATRTFLSPLQFSIDCDIDEDKAISLFAICTEKDISLLGVRYTIDCPCCQNILTSKSYSHVSGLPKSVYCPECDMNVPVTRDNLIIWFNLLKEPEQQPFGEYEQHLIRRGAILGKI